MSRWLSASEITTAGLPDLPVHLNRASEFIARIATINPELVRPRAGKGGGREIAILALPEAARAELARRAQAEALAQAGEDQAAADRAADQRQIATRVSGTLTARQRIVMEARTTVLLAIEQRAQAGATGRGAAIAGFLDDIAAGRLDEAQRAVIAQANDKAADATLSRPSLYRWFAARDRAGVIGLAPETTRDKTALPAWFDGFLRHYQRPTKPSLLDALRAYTSSLPAGATVPTERQVRLALKKLPVLARLKGRHGALALRARMAYIARTFDDVLPSSIYVADGKTFDAEIAHPIHGQPFRPELTTLVDVASRRAVGWSVSLDENTFGVVDALRMACEACGIPAIFYTDRGPGYKNKAMDLPLTGFLARASITAMRALPYNSQAKGVVERLNQIYTSAAKSMPSYIGKDMDKQAKQLVHRRSRQELNATGTSRLITGWGDFLEAISRVIETYNNRPHSELPKILDPQLARQRHQTPNECWAAKSAGVEMILPDDEESADLFRPYVKRRTRRALVDWLGNSYFAQALEALDGTDVLVGYDIHDASRVWVREIDWVDGELQPGRLIAIAQFNGHATRYVPLSFERAAIERRAKGRVGRLEKKLEVVRAELAPAVLAGVSTHSVVAHPPGAAQATGAHPPPVPVAVPDQTSQVSRDRPMFQDDVGFARWLAANPELVTEGDRTVLRELLLTHSTNELLRMSGVDLTALRSIARSTAGQAGAAAETDDDK